MKTYTYIYLYHDKIPHLSVVTLEPTAPAVEDVEGKTKTTETDEGAE